jgi:putative hemolysin
LPGDDQGIYQTLAGFVIMQLGRIPAASDSFVWEQLKIEVVDMDGNRVDKVLVTPTDNGNVDSDVVGGV